MKIAYLVNRERLLQQLKNEVIKQGKDRTIFILTYQSLEKPLLRGNDNQLLDGFDYIVSDEFHYFMSDSTFNNRTDLSFNHIMSKTKSCRIFMSATCDTILSYMKTRAIKTVDYRVDSKKDNIEKLYFSFEDEVIKKYLVQIPDDEKAVYFVQNIEKAYDLYREFQCFSSMFLCSSNNKIYSSKLDKIKINNIIENGTFEEKYLFCTTALDNGVNLADEKIKHIVVDIKDFDLLVQCIGRKRMLHDNDKFTLIVRAMNGRVINAICNNINFTIKKAEKLKQGVSVSEIVKEFPREDNGALIYDVACSDNSSAITKKVNDFPLYKHKNDLKQYTKILDEHRSLKDGRSSAYINKIVELLGKEEYTILEDELDEISINDHLLKLIDIKMFKEDQDKFKEWFSNNLVNAPKNRNGGVGLKTLNMFLKENNFKYEIINKKENRAHRRGETYWIVRLKPVE